MKKITEQYLFTKKYNEKLFGIEGAEHKVEITLIVDYENIKYTLINKDDKFSNSFSFDKIGLDSNKDEATVLCLKEAIEFAKKLLSNIKI